MSDLNSKPQCKVGAEKYEVRN